MKIAKKKNFKIATKKNFKIAIVSIILIQISFETILLLSRNDKSWIEDRELNKRPHISESTRIQKRNKDGECSLYLATSSIPNAGLGVYTAKAIPPNTKIKELADILIPLYDIHNIHHKNDKETFWWLVQSYHWDAPHLLQPVQEVEVKESTFLAPFTSSINGHPGIKNIGFSTIKYDLVNLDRTKDPGAGAISPYTKMYPSSRSNALSPGQELFFSYGDRWFRMREDVLGQVPLSEDYELADRIITDFVKKYELSNTATGTLMFNKKMIGSRKRLQSRWNKILERTPTERIQNALPKKIEDIPHIYDVGTSQSLVPDSIRSIKWLSQNGYCVDHMYIKQSTISQAGRGAFASSAIAMGSIVAPVPTIHTNRDAMKMVGKGNSYQLLMNYCFGNKLSSLILCPYGSLTHLINHANGGDQTPNVALQWASTSFPHFEHSWLSQPVHEVLKHEHSGLMLEVVALRDINQDEEILIDYGQDWAEAWHDHVKNWKPANSSYIPATAMNDYDKNDLQSSIIRTKTEQSSDPYPPNLKTFCEYFYQPKHQSDTSPDSEGDLPKIIIREQFVSSQEYEIDFDDIWKFLRPCTILERTLVQKDTDSVSNKIGSLQQDHYVYSAQILNEYKDYEENQERIPTNEIHIIEGIPREKIFFRDTPYSTDPQMPNTFRKEIGLPESLLPKAWKDLGK